ncbi:hypothetical protein BD289DRAFT_16630 [Coniella lustricola]|uniref:Uncharacterized protein n=1 Tax=Coniella lustricola TaxID=2025994 RepID=A0A2T3A3S9_9PEZI|nr:hypothetical protein BD289DRAFT_16630 [Coniella lustricola]
MFCRAYRSKTALDFLDVAQVFQQTRMPQEVHPRQCTFQSCTSNPCQPSLYPCTSHSTFSTCPNPRPPASPSASLASPPSPLTFLAVDCPTVVRHAERPSDPRNKVLGDLRKTLSIGARSIECMALMTHPSQPESTARGLTPSRLQSRAIGHSPRCGRSIQFPAPGPASAMTALATWDSSLTRIFLLDERADRCSSIRSGLELGCVASPFPLLLANSSGGTAQLCQQGDQSPSPSLDLAQYIVPLDQSVLARTS